MNKLTKKPTGNDLVSTIMSDSFKKQVAMALPKHLTPDRFLRVALTELRKVPELAGCDPKSFLGAIVQCSQLGLEPGDGLGQAYLLPFDNNKTGKKECQLIIGFRGLIELARRSGQLESIQAQCVFENDFFEFEYGLNEKLRHVPTREEKGDLFLVYAIARFKDGGHQMEVMFKKDIDRVKETSKSAKSRYSPWHTHYDAMARKTVIRRIAKYLPSSPELQHAVTIDEKADLGFQDLATDFSVIDNKTGEIIEKEPPKPQADVMLEKMKDIVEKKQ